MSQLSEKKNGQITAHLTHEDQQAVLNLAAADGVSASEWIRALVTNHLKELRRDVLIKADILGVRKTLCDLGEFGLSDKNERSQS